MKINLQCMSCGEKLEITETSMPYTVDGVTNLDVAVDPCACQIKAPAVDDTPIRLPYLTLARILEKKVVNLTYHKKNGEIREMSGYLGENDLRSITGTVHYFHEIGDGTNGGSKTQCKCIYIDRIMGVEYVDDDAGVRTLYEVEESI